MEDDIDSENWMSKLPDNCHTIPVNWLAVPGSHNSLTFDLDKTCQLAPDAPEAVNNLVTFFGPLAKSLVHSWSTNQSLSTKDQLKAGIRYLDIRVGAKPETEDLFAVHGLYGPTIKSCLDDLGQFLDSHPKEIVFLDFNHFYGLDLNSHERLVQDIIDRFSSKMCPLVDVSSVTLQMLWENGLQLIVFYHHHPLVEQHFQLWPGSLLPAPWHNKTAVPDLLVAVARGLEDRCTKYSDVFHVTQGILTPDNGCIMSNLTGSLKSSLCMKLANPFVDWVRRQRSGVTGVNIVTMDFVEMAEFVPCVIRLNFRVS